MKTWATEIKAIDWRDGILKTFGGPNVPGINKDDATNYLWQVLGLGMFEVKDELVMEIPCKEGTNEPDWNNAIDYYSQVLN